MFTGELAESRQTEIIIHDVDETAMELLIDYCYTSRIVVDEKNVQMLLPAACILQVRTESIASVEQQSRCFSTRIILPIDPI
jgi:hypothetical protein